MIYAILSPEMLTHKNMTNQEVARLLRQVAAAYEVKGENRFRIAAYEEAATSIEHATSQVKDIWEDKQLESIPGVGKNICSHLDELFRTGKVKHFSQVSKNLPAGMFELLDIPGIGAKTAFKLAKHLGLTKAHTAVAKLKKSATQGEIASIEGFGEESQKAILAGIGQVKKHDSRLSIGQADSIAKKLISYMKGCLHVVHIDPLGSLRRRVATVGDIDIAVATAKPKTCIKHFVAYPETKTILAHGDNTARIKLKNGLQVDIKAYSQDQYGTLLQHFTGSKSHNIKLREIALKKGMSLSEHGVKKKKAQLKKFSTEENFYNHLGMDWIPPELREDAGEIEAAQKHTLPKLIKHTDIKGDLHTHTSYNWISSHDAGANNPEEMIQKAVQLGYQYLGLTDHNPSLASYKPTQITDQVKKRSQQLNSLKQKYKSKIHILNGLEVDIRTNGELAITPEGIEALDYAVASIHSSMRTQKADMTKRVLSGLSHPKAKILGHPSGRLINKREAYELDWPKIFEFCVKHNKFIEINAQPKRLDLPDTLVRLAIKAGVKLIINTDSHAKTQLEFMRFGVDVARRGWATKNHIINALPLKAFLDKIDI